MKALLQLAGLPRSTFYYYLHQSQKPVRYQMVKEEIVAVFNKNKKRYGYRRITQELHNNGIYINHKTVQKLMKQLGLVCHVRERRKYNSYKGEIGEVAPNLLERHFKTNEPNRKWVTDVTEFKVNDQKLYLSPIIDLFNGIEFFQIEQFRLEQAKEVFSNRIIQTSGFPGHTLCNAFRSQQVLVRLHLVLPALI